LKVSFQTMPTEQSITPILSAQRDQRIFGFTVTGQIRANLHNSPASYAPGALYSWLTCATIDQLAHKLESWNDDPQPVTEEEFDTLEQLEAANAEFEIDCEDCGATGVDPGGLSASEPEECPACHGAKRISLAAVYASMVTAPVSTPRKPAASVTAAITPGVAA
jgi:hypothetical protein